VLSLPAGPDKPLLLTVTYVVVIFSIVVQGLTVRQVIQRFVRDA
jgi:CPA1 family monovalent cation:H+ antiporter